MKILLSCGGTGGHIYPAIAIAERIKKEYPDAEFLFVGTKKGMENRIIPAAGFEISGIDASGFDRKNLLKNFRTVSDMIRGAHDAAQIIRSFGPDIAIGTGAYVTGTVLGKAHEAGVRCFIQEQNAMPGVTNKMLEPIVEKVFLSFESAKQHFRHPEKCIVTGNPIRADFSGLKKTECRAELGVAENDVMVLITGGSLGAQMLNDAALRLIDESAGKDIKLFFVTGRRYHQEVSEALAEKSEAARANVRLIDYADNMPVLMTAADIVVSRAGAIAVSELLACGKPSVLVPSPNVTNNHQYWNAKAVADCGAALLLEESALKEDMSALSSAVLSLSEDRAKLGVMSDAAYGAAKTDAADRIFRELGI